MTPEELKYFLIVQSKVHLTFTYSWSRSETVYTLRNGARLQNIKHFAIYCHVEQPAFPFWGIFHCIKNFQIILWRFQKCSSYIEYSYSKMTEKRQRPTPGVRLIDWSVRYLRVDCTQTSVGYMPKKRPKKQNPEKKRNQLWLLLFDFFTTRGAYHLTENSEIPDGR